MAQLMDYQLEAIDKMKNGCILCGNVGAGKSRTAIAYYYLKVCQGDIRINGVGKYRPMKFPRKLFIITTAKKRDSLEWEKELAHFNIQKKFFIIDSWNNIKKYKDVYGAFFIFDEQRLIGNGVWVKSFYNIARKNKWILLTATPGDEWKDYIPVFIANGFYRNKTEFNAKHCVFSRFSKFPKIERYVGQKELRRNRDSILIPMADQRITQRHNIYINCEYDKALYKKVFISRWDPFDDEPIQECSKWHYLQRMVCNTDESRLKELDKIVNKHDKIIIFYNFNYELEMLRDWLSNKFLFYAEWNGHNHEEIPETDFWVYLVQYSAGCEGWNCIETDTIVFFSQNYSYRILEQASGRIDRMNTPFKDLYYYHLKSNSYIDNAIYKKLINKKSFNEDIKLFNKYKGDD